VAASINDPFTARRGGSRRRRGGRRALSEINVTPLVDVMLVLLIIFMVSAPLLTAGVPVELPKTEAGAMDEQTEPLTVTVQADGKIFLGETETPFASLGTRLREAAGTTRERQVYVRADGKAAYETVARVMAALSTSGFSSIGLLTDTGGPSSGGPSSGAREREGR
jgi:biopolymer transport protein TolR